VTEPKPVYIYSLTDPRTGEVRYIGQSIRPRERLTNHFHDRCRTYRTYWLRELRTLGIKPTLAVLETVPPGADWWIGNVQQAAVDALAADAVLQAEVLRLRAEIARLRRALDAAGVVLGSDG
jgi:hypothetical protein